MKTKKIAYPPIQIGTSFMLVIFLTLCMVIFAVLSLSSAVKDYNYSQKNAARTTAYYEACNAAEPPTKNETISYTVPIDEDELLQVVLTTQPQGEKPYTITSWQQLSTSEWTGDQTLPVLKSK